MTPLQSPRGTRDILPNEQLTWLRVTETCRSVAQQFGFLPLSLPSFEEVELFQRSIGSGTDIIDKELFLIHNRHAEEGHYALRPEGTAGMVRAYIQHGMQTWPQPVKLYGILNLFRYERPQKGRYREHTQFDIEYFGDTTPFADAWVILSHWRVLQRLQIQNVVLEINSLGTSSERAVFRDALLAYLEPLQEQLSEDSKRRLSLNPLRILDSKDPADQEIVTNAPELRQFLGAESQAHFEALSQYLTSWEIPFRRNPRLVRGLDYYSQTCFEWVHQKFDGRPLSVGGGGRYDNLLPQLGGPASGAVGAGLGLDRLVDILLEENLATAATPPDLYIVRADSEEGTLALIQGIIKDLAQTNWLLEADFSKSSIGSQLKAANRLHARYAVIIGAAEVSKGSATVKNLSSGEQFELLFAEIANYDFA